MPSTPAPYVWRFLLTGKTKHALTRDQFSMQSPASGCGIMPLWYLPAVALWQDDPEGLAARTECRNCANFLKNEGYR